MSTSNQDILGFPVYSPVQQIRDPRLDRAAVELWIKREDLIHPVLSGNKWRKLKYNLIEARKRGQNRLLTFGGAYSNHLYATAAAGRIFGFETVAVVRGEETLPLNPRLQYMRDQGMVLRYMDRSTYRNKSTGTVLAQLSEEYPDSYVIPEGGSNELAIPGVLEAIEKLFGFDYYACACGSGGTTAGLLAGCHSATVLAVAVLKGAGFLAYDVHRLLESHSQQMQIDRLDLQLDYHFGGYAKRPKELLDFVADFKRRFDIAIEPIYTGKLFYALFDLIEKGYFPRGTKMLALHTGGL